MNFKGGCKFFKTFLKNCMHIPLVEMKIFRPSMIKFFRFKSKSSTGSGRAQFKPGSDIYALNERLTLINSKLKNLKERKIPFANISKKDPSTAIRSANLKVSDSDPNQTLSKARITISQKETKSMAEPSKKLIIPKRLFRTQKPKSDSALTTPSKADEKETRMSESTKLQRQMHQEFHREDITGASSIFNALLLKNKKVTESDSSSKEAPFVQSKYLKSCKSNILKMQPEKKTLDKISSIVLPTVDNVLK